MNAAGPCIRQPIPRCHSLLLITCAVLAGGFADAQDQGLQLQGSQAKESSVIEEILEPELLFRLETAQSKIIRTRMPVTRIAITNPSIVEVNEFSPKELEIIGLADGRTTVTFWFEGPNGEEILRYLVQVGPDEMVEVPPEPIQPEVEFGQLQARINEMFPNSFVQLVPIADKLIVRGQARDAREASEIISVISGQSTDQAGNAVFSMTTPIANLPNAEELPTTAVINLLDVPGEHQVMLKVRMAELTRNAAREMGFDFEILDTNVEISHAIGGRPGNFTAILDGGDVSLFLKAFSENGMGKLLAEPTLVTLSGQTATFLAGGEFPVPTAVGVDGIGAVSTYFQSFGTQLSFTPTVIDKDKIRLQVAPQFSSLNNAIAVDGIPGLNTRGATTTVDLREGQWLAIAGLIQDEQRGSRTRFPFLGGIPYVGQLFSDQTTQRNETELVILVSPELVHPLEAEQVPLLLPGMEVTDPTNKEFFFHGQIEGDPRHQYRSTVWPAQRHDLIHQIKGTRGAHCNVADQPAQNYYMSGEIGFSQ